MTKNQLINAAAIKLGITPPAIYSRLANGFSFKDATTLPRGASRVVRRVTNRVSQTVTTTTHKAAPPAIQRFGFSPNTRVILDLNTGTLTLEPIAA